jgi:hypothetical protein
MSRANFRVFIVLAFSSATVIPTMACTNSSTSTVRPSAPPPPTVAFSPSRPANPFDPVGEVGPAYPTFNNYRYPPGPLDKAGSARKHDERRFLLAKWCDQGTCDDNAYFDSVDLSRAKVGDWVEFEIYAHNNGSDPYAGGARKSKPDARDVVVGIDVTNQESPTGFIYSPDNSYRAGADTVKYRAADYRYEAAAPNSVARTAADRVNLKGLPKHLSLQLRDQWAVVYMAYGRKSAKEEQASIDELSTDGLHTFMYNRVPAEGRKIVFTNATPPHMSRVSYTAERDEHRKGVRFSTIPGGYRYHSYIQFRAAVVEPSTR